jgi:N6-adenosine-specific RNA methylase IME4
MRCSKPLKRYGVIYADPPWHFKNFSEKGTGRNPVAHYTCMDFNQIAALQPQRWAAKDCVLFLWATDPLLPKALELIEAWGFTYKTVGFYWAKTNKRANLETLSVSDFFTGLGYWSRANIEQCLLATRGSPPRMAKDVKRLVIAPRREHSSAVFVLLIVLLPSHGRAEASRCWSATKSITPRSGPSRTRTRTWRLSAPR